MCRWAATRDGEFGERIRGLGRRNAGEVASALHLLRNLDAVTAGLALNWSSGGCPGRLWLGGEDPPVGGGGAVELYHVPPVAPLAVAGVAVRLP